ncbi:unnamed protein product [Leptidea sinapis]|uniref:Uncharacterized protein n=1 Tax=Leptidea sinapis TaxID=189913 RepID=A0A5E4QAY7_9NEOP|nr:unnamed protein product [Leptidea sinapis]
MQQKEKDPPEVKTSSRRNSVTPISDFEEQNSKCGTRKFVTSTPKPSQGQPGHTDRHNVSLESTVSKDSSTNSNSVHQHCMSTEVEISSVSPSSAVSSVSDTGRDALPFMSPHSQDFLDSGRDPADVCEGEWGRFWSEYQSQETQTRFYDQCPTPYRSGNFDATDFDIPNECSRKRSPEDLKNISNIIRNDGLRLTPRETQNVIKCAHILGNVLTKAIDRQSKEMDQNEKIKELKNNTENELKKKNLSLNLRETAQPLEVKEEKRCESIATQTDISLPNTKSAPKIFESILRQLSKSSLDENDETVETNDQLVP